MLKRNLVLMMLAVLFVVAGANAALDPGINLFPSGDMENGGDAWTPPLYWSAVGVNPGQGTVGVSSDIRPGSTGVQSLCVTGYNDNYGTYSHDYADQSGYAAGTQITVSYWIKGDVYTAMSHQGGGGITRISGDGTQWLRGIDWTYFEGVYEVTADVNGFSYYCYDNSEAGESAYMDDLVMMVVGPDSELLEGDANRDGQVSAGDYASVQVNFGNTGAENDPELFGDANLDGIVSAGDYASVQANFGNTSGAAVPEPMTMSLLGFGGLALIRRRK